MIVVTYYGEDEDWKNDDHGSVDTGRAIRELNSFLYNAFF